MLTVTNNLSSHLVIPKGSDGGVALKLAPKASAKVDKVTGPVKEAERSGLVVIHYPEVNDADDKAPARGKSNKSKKKG